MKPLNRFRKQNAKPVIESRRFFVHQMLPSGILEDVIPMHYPNNAIKTSKYTTLNFLPKNLFEQFRRIANFYFLCLCIINFSINSPISPLTTLFPLMFVVIVTGFKQGYEDWKRHREDNKVNNDVTFILKENEIRETSRSAIQVGDIVKVADDEEFPCDLLLLASSNDKGKCDVTTANLDGESNLKTFFCPADVDNMQSIEKLSSFSAVIECQHPQPNLYDFKGRMDAYNSYEEEPLVTSLNTDNLLLRGARLKNTDYIYGCAVYTGKDTKMALNSKLTSNKFSTAERTTNFYLLFYLGILVTEVFLVTLLKYKIFNFKQIAGMWYLTDVTLSTDFKSILQDSFSFFILFSYIIPISLYVTLEMQKFLSSFFFQWDEEMRSKVTGEAAICNTSDLNEELGQVQYLFTDKTGTLTENIMHFRQCSVAGVKFADGGNFLKSIDEESISPLPTNATELLESFLVTLSLCHTVRASKTLHPDYSYENVEDLEGEIPLGEFQWDYLASSPDEQALVEASAAYNVVFEGEIDGNLVVNVQGIKKSFKLLEVLEFDSDRKLMSVIVRDLQDKQIWLLTKGAEVSVFRRCLVQNSEDEMLHDITMKHINDFAGLGLRTLAVAKKKMSEEELHLLSKKMSSAREVIQNRDEAVRHVMDEIETGMKLMGATGVEDLLQEGVQETLESLSVAGIKVWVLTGDKVETAVNIAYMCGLFKKFMTILHLTHLDSLSAAELKLQESEVDLLNTDFHFGLVVDGTSLLLLLEEFDKYFYQICSQCSAVVCCRMSPKQKAEIVKLVKNFSGKRTVCAAVGDGANDVSMIQEAHIGLGIMGKEGRQAVRCSDFAVAQFRFLQRALLVHGHWYYTRIATLIQYCFYKNVAFITPQVYFSFQSAYSTESIYEGLVLTFINVTLTALPIIIYGLFEQPYSDKTLLSKPYLYKEIAGNKNMSWKVFITWGLLGFWHSLVMYYGLVGATYDTPYVPGGKSQDIFLFGMLLTNQVVLVCNIKLVIETKYQTLLFIGSIAITFLGYYLLYLVYCDIFPTFGIYWTFYVMHTCPSFYFTFILLLFVCLLPDVLIKVYENEQKKLIVKSFTQPLKLMKSNSNNAGTLPETYILM